MEFFSTSWVEVYPSRFEAGQRVLLARPSKRENWRLWPDDNRRVGRVVEGKEFFELWEGVRPNLASLSVPGRKRHFCHFFRGVAF